MTIPNQRNLQLRFPADNGYLRVSRLAATTLAADLGFDVDALDDLRLAVAEVVNYLVESSTADHVVLRFETDHSAFRLEGTTGVDIDESGRREDSRAVDDSAVDDSGVDDLLHAVLGATTDDYRIGVVDNHRYVSLTRQLAHETGASMSSSADASATGSE